MTMKIRVLAGAAVAAITLGLGVQAGAAPLSFSESAIASGSLDGTSFVDALVTLSGSGDTSDITNPSPGIYSIFDIPVEVTVTGVGSDGFSDAIALVSNQSDNAVGVGDFTIDRAILFTGGVDNSSYDLSTSFGPVTGGASFNLGTTFATSGGVFEIDSADTATYQATVSAAPEPSIWALMIAGLGLTGMTLRARHRVGLA